MHSGATIIDSVNRPSWLPAWIRLNPLTSISHGPPQTPLITSVEASDTSASAMMPRMGRDSAKRNTSAICNSGDDGSLCSGGCLGTSAKTAKATTTPIAAEIRKLERQP